MNNSPNIINERVDDLPLLLAQLKQMGVSKQLDKHFPTHGNWQGLSLGWVATVWLSYILSQGDHRLSHVQPWAEKRSQTLRRCIDLELRVLDFSDDRLEAVLRYLSEDEPWREFEQELGGKLVQVYDLSVEKVRLDATTASGYFGVTEEGLFQWGHNKDHRPDLTQVKVMLSTLDPLGLPVATEVVAGNRADDPLYIPAVNRVRNTLNRRGLLYIGDCKMAAVATRAYIEAGGDYYLCPLPATQLATGELESYLEPVWTGNQELTSIEYTYPNGEKKEIALGYCRSIPRNTSINGSEVTWTERQLVVRSLATAAQGEKSLRTRLAKAQEALLELGQPGRGKKRLTQLEEWQAAVSEICQRYRVQGLLNVEYQLSTQERSIRRYGNRPARVIQSNSVQLSVTLDEAAVADAIRMMGWRVYVTNQTQEALSLEKAVVAYRQEYLIERGFGRFKGFPLSLRPMYLQREDHIKGLIRLLSIGLRVLTLTEWKVRRRLASLEQKLAGLYAGNPKRATARPTAEKLLAAFKEITLLLIEGPHQSFAHLTSLSPLQQQILALLEFPLEIYTQLSSDGEEPP